MVTADFICIYGKIIKSKLWVYISLLSSLVRRISDWKLNPRGKLKGLSQNVKAVATSASNPLKYKHSLHLSEGTPMLTLVVFLAPFLFELLVFCACFFVFFVFCAYKSSWILEVFTEIQMLLHFHCPPWLLGTSCASFQTEAATWLTRRRDSQSWRRGWRSPDWLKLMGAVILSTKAGSAEAWERNVWLGLFLKKPYTSKTWIYLTWHHTIGGI